MLNCADTVAEIQAAIANLGVVQDDNCTVSVVCPAPDSPQEGVYYIQFSDPCVRLLPVMPSCDSPI